MKAKENVNQFSSIQFSRPVVSDSVSPWITACQASLSITNSRSLLKLMSIESVMPSSHLILCHPLLLLPPIPPSIRFYFFQWVNSSHEVANKYQITYFQKYKNLSANKGTSDSWGHRSTNGAFDKLRLDFVTKWVLA